MTRCYDCGIELHKGNTTREHIPAQNLFEGFPDEYKMNRLTVKACQGCNSRYSKIDNELRDAIGMMNDNNPLQKDITGKAVRSILRRKDWEERFSFQYGRLPGISFSYDNFKELHIKNFKGTFYSKYNFPFPADFEIGVVSEGDESDDKAMNFAQAFYNFVAEKNEWLISGHEDVFKYSLRLGKVENGMFVETQDLDDAIFIACVLVYHKKLCPVIFAMRTDFINEMQKEKQP